MLVGKRVRVLEAGLAAFWTPRLLWKRSIGFFLRRLVAATTFAGVRAMRMRNRYSCA